MIHKMDNDPVIAIVMATMLEAKPFIDGMSLTESEKKPFVLFSNGRMRLIVSGIGKSNAAMAVTYSCLKFAPDWVCNLGAAGATRFSLPPGSIFHITKVFEHDRPDFTSGSPRIHTPDTLEHFQTGTLATADKPVLDPDARKRISADAGLVDMEGAAVIQACRKFQTKCLLFKFVSDTPDHTRSEDIISNIRLHRLSFYAFFADAVLPLLLK